MTCWHTSRPDVEPTSGQNLGILRLLVSATSMIKRHLVAISALLFFCCATATAAESALPKRLVVVNSASWIPYSFLDEAGEPRGVLIDLWQLFAQKNNIEVEFRLLDWAKSIELVRNGEAHVHGGLIPTEAREEFLHFFPREWLRVRTLVFFDEEMSTRDLAALNDTPLGVVAETA